MSRKPLFLLAVVVAATSLAVTTAAAAPIKVIGTVGPGETIGMRVGGKKASKLKAGATYRFVISDRSEDHDFRLVGPGVSRVLTGVEFVGTKSVTLKLKAGGYRFFCAPHADDMHGGFRAAR